MDETWMMTPAPCCTIAGRKARSRADRGEQVRVERLLPSGVGQRQGPTARRGGTTDVVDHDIEAAETLHDHLDDVVDPCARTDVGLQMNRSRAARGKIVP